MLSIDVSLTLDLRVSLRLWISPGLLWKQSPLLPRSPLMCPNAPSEPAMFKMGPLLSSQGSRPAPRLLDKGLPSSRSLSPCGSREPFQILGSFFRSQAPGCRRRPRFRVDRGGPVATIAIKSLDKAVHGRICLVSPPRPRRSLLDHISAHRRSWSAIGSPSPHSHHRRGAALQYTVSVAFAGRISVPKFSDCPSNWAPRSCPEFRVPVRDDPPGNNITSPPLERAVRSAAERANEQSP